MPAFYGKPLEIRLQI